MTAMRYRNDVIRLVHILHIHTNRSKVRAKPLELNLSELVKRVILQMCAAIPRQSIHRLILSMTIRYLAVQSIKAKVITA